MSTSHRLQVDVGGRFEAVGAARAIFPETDLDLRLKLLLIQGGYVDGDRMFALAQGLGAAKSRQDVQAALTFLAPDMLLENPAFGTSVRGLPENERALTRWFKMFPDYQVVLEGHANNTDTLICWGTVRMTMTGERFGVVPNGRRMELPVYIQFTFKGDRIASERFFFDLSELCAQSGISTDVMRQKLFGSAHAPPAS